MNLDLSSRDWAHRPLSRRYLDNWRAVGRLLFRGLFRLQVLDRDRLPPRGPYIVAANHPSYLDPLLVGYAIPAVIRVMTWDAVMRLPVLGRLAASAGAFPVNLASPRGAIAALRTAQEVLEAGGVLLIFPEGGRSRPDGSLERFQPGVGRLAALVGCPVYPAAVLGTWRIWPRGQALPRPGPVRIAFLPPVMPELPTASEEARSRSYHEAFTREVERRIRSVVDQVRRHPRTRRGGLFLPPGAAATLTTSWDRPTTR